MLSLDLNHTPAKFLTNRYNNVDTQALISAFNDAGFNVSSQAKAALKKPFNPELQAQWNVLPLDVKVKQLDMFNRRLERYAARLGHEKHFIRLQSHELNTRAKGHELFLRVTNSYDGTSSLKVSLDILRLVCLNGMVAPRSLFEISVKHSNKNIYEQAIAASYKIVAQKEVIDEQIDRMSSKALNTDEKLQLVDAMFGFRYGKDSELVLSPSKKLDLLKPTRVEEKDDNLYQNFNTLQEKFTRGARVALLDADGREIVRTVREVKSQVTADSFNDNSWNFALKLA